MGDARVFAEIGDRARLVKVWDEWPKKRLKERHKRACRIGRGLLLGSFLIAWNAAAQEIPFLDAELTCGSLDECYDSLSPECLKLSDREKANRRHQLSECVEEQQNAYEAARSRLSQLSESGRAECLQRLDKYRNYRILGDCVSQKLAAIKEKNERLHAPQNLRR